MSAPVLLHPRRMAICVLAWLLLSLGVAIAAPWVQPQSMQLACSASGVVKLLVQADDGSVHEAGTRGMDCPLCGPAWAPQPGLPGGWQPAADRAPVCGWVAPDGAAVVAAAPLPARGPPRA